MTASACAAALAGTHDRVFLGHDPDNRERDSFSGPKASFALGLTAVGCIARARCKVVEAHLLIHERTLAQTLIDRIGGLYRVPRGVAAWDAHARASHRQSTAAPKVTVLHAPRVAQRAQGPFGGPTALTMGFSSRRFDK